MTDARLKGEWLTAPAHDGLTDAAYRVLHNALMHSAEQGTDGAITRRELRFLYPGTLEPAVLTEISDAGFWEPTDDGYQLLGWSTTLGQSTAADVEQYRTAARERQRRKRDRDRTQTPTSPTTSAALAAENTPPGGETPDSAHDDAQHDLSRRDAHRDVTRDVGQDRTGQARPVRSSDLTHTSTRQSPPKRASDATDAMEVPDVTKRLATQKGITSLTLVAAAVQRHADRRVNAVQAYQVAAWILEKAPTWPDAPQRYVSGSIAQSPFEVQQYIDEELIAS